MRLPLSLLALTLSCSLPAAYAQSAPPDKDASHPKTAPHDHDKVAPQDENASPGEDEAKPPADEKLIDYFWRKSDVAFHAGDYPRAIGLHRAIIALDPTEIESYSLGAWLSWSLGKSDDALKFIDDGLKANPDNPDMWDAAGEQYDLQKLFAQSQNAFGKAVELSGKDADQMLRRRYAHALEHAGNLAKSAEVWRGLVTDFPAETVNKNNLERVEKAAQDATTARTQVAALGGVLITGLCVYKVCYGAPKTSRAQV